MQPRRAEDGLCSFQERFQTFGRTGCAMEGFSVLALSKATPVIYHSCSIYLYLVNTSLPYYVQFIFKAVLQNCVLLMYKEVQTHTEDVGQSSPCVA